MTETERRENWIIRHPGRPHGWQNGGLRFRVQRRKNYLPLIEDPNGCADLMTNAVIGYRCPVAVISICMVLEENGCRWREAAWATALGWSIKGFGEHVYTTNKGQKGEHAKRISLPPDALGNLTSSFENRPHPTSKDKSMMDYLKELAKVRNEAALRAIPLFSSSRGRRYAYSTFNGYWFLPAMRNWRNEDGSLGLTVRSDVSERRPTSHWYRHAEITRALEIELPRCKTDADVIEASMRVCRSFNLKTDQAKRYAAALMRRMADEDHMRRVLERRQLNEAKRRDIGIPVGLPRLELSDSERFVLALPDRQKLDA